MTSSDWPFKGALSVFALFFFSPQISFWACLVSEKRKQKKEKGSLSFGFFCFVLFQFLVFDTKMLQLLFIYFFGVENEDAAAWLKKVELFLISVLCYIVLLCYCCD